MVLIFIHILNGISFGMILFLIAIGLSITLGVMGILNLAHGALFMIGGFVGYTLVTHGVNFWLAVLIGGVGAGLVGLIAERVFLSRLYKQFDNQVLLTLGLVYIIQNLSLWIYGGAAKSFSAPVYLKFAVAIGDYRFPAYRLTLIALGAVLLVILWLVIERTKLGSIVRAGMDDKEMAMGLGLNYPLTCSLVFAFGAFVCGLAGVLAAPIIGVVHSMPMEILLYAMIVVIVGGPGSVSGTFLAALVIGIVDSIGKAYFPDFAMFTIYIVFIGVLLIKPAGLMGKKALSG